MTDNREFKDFKDLKKRLFAGFAGVVTVLLVGGIGYYLIGRGAWSFYDCFYMTAITISTVGFGEVIDVSSAPEARLFTVFLIIFGMGIIVYFGSTIVAIFVEGEIKHFFRRNKMIKQIEKLNNHIILCGAGATGRYIVRELIATRTPFVVIDENEHQVHMVEEEEGTPFFYIIGDASEDPVLKQAGIEKARGLIAALPEDKDNLFVVVSARQFSSKIRIISKGIEPTIAEKLKRAGADTVISPNFIGGMRMASTLLRPNVVEFLDLMLRDKEKNMRVEETTIQPGSFCDGKTLAEVGIKNIADVLILAVRHDGHYRHNPPADFLLRSGQTLIILAPVEDVIKFRAAVQPG